MSDFPTLRCRCGKILAITQVAPSGKRVCPCLHSWAPSDDQKYLVPAPQEPPPASIPVTPSQNPFPAAPGDPTASQTGPLPANPTASPGTPPTQNTTPGAPASPTPSPAVPGSIQVVGNLILKTPSPLHLPAVSPTRLLKDAQDNLRKDFSQGKGGHCENCGQTTKKWEHSLDSAMSQALLDFYKFDRKNPGVWATVPDIFVHYDTRQGGKYAKLRHWGLIEEREGTNDQGNPNLGDWRITSEGRLFVEKKALVPKYVVIFDNTVVEQFGEPISFTDAIGTKFNYQDLFK